MNPKPLSTKVCAGCSNPEFEHLRHVVRNDELVCPSCAFYVDQAEAERKASEAK